MYRGQHGTDGSLFIQRGRAPARVMKVCRDIADTWDPLFTYTGGKHAYSHKALPPDPFPLSVYVLAKDSPADSYLVEQKNELTEKKNYLDEVQIELEFCTILAVRDPASVVHFLAHVYWNVRWHYTFHPTRYPPGGNTSDWTVTKIDGGTGGTMRRFNSPPTDRRVAQALAAGPWLSCNDVASRAANAEDPGGPGRHAYKNRGHTPDVRR
jgi:hypothetical protein